MSFEIIRHDSTWNLELVLQTEEKYESEKMINRMQ